MKHGRLWLRTTPMIAVIATVLSVAVVPSDPSTAPVGATPTPAHKR